MFNIWSWKMPRLSRNILNLDFDEFESLPTLYPGNDWVVAHGYTGKFNEIKKQITKKLSNVIKTIAVPYWMNKSNSDKSESLVLEPIFPGYLFVDIASPLENWTYLEDIEGIFRVLTESCGNGNKKKPCLLTPFEVAYIMDLTVSSMRLSEPDVYSLKNSEVIVTEGIFRNFHGVVIEDGREIKIDLHTSARIIPIRINRLKVAKVTCNEDING